ncbi:hypothetical protein ACF3NG_04225 [Aerococcaceae bacterium WGS1372]
MNYKFPVTFYLKLIFIIAVLLFAYLNNQSFIQETMADETLGFQESVTSIMREVMDITNKLQSRQLDTEYISNYAEPGNITPYEINEQVKVTENYQVATQKATEFNQAIDMYALNDALIHKVNYMRSNLAWEPITVGYHLEEGANARVKELTENQYLSSLTIDGQDFRSHFYQISEPQYRLGENLYELYISAGDIHLSTWKNPKIFADYLYEVFSEAISLSNYDVYSSQYIAVRAEATDYNVDESPYIRLVVSLVSDTMEE